MFEDFKKPAVSTEEIVGETVKKYSYLYQTIVTLIAVLEVIMTVRGLIRFDLTEPRRIVYMVCYIVLLGFSVFGLFCLRSVDKRLWFRRNIAKIVYAYCIVLTVWSALISAMDVFGGQPPIVFMTVLMGVAALAFINPRGYLSLVVPLSIFMALFCFRHGAGAVGRSGFITNFLVFVVISFFTTVQQHRQNQRDFSLMKHLESLSYHDQLTGMLNRQALHDHLKEGGNEIFYFGILDFDNFKVINDTYGHDFGDECLREGTRLMQRFFGERVYRYGGDEFVILSTMRGDDILRSGDALNRELAKLFPDREVHMSGGFYFPHSGSENFEDYLKQADDALYDAKRQGKAKFVVNQ